MQQHETAEGDSRRRQQHQFVCFVYVNIELVFAAAAEYIDIFAVSFCCLLQQLLLLHVFVLYNKEIIACLI